MHDIVVYEYARVAQYLWHQVSVMVISSLVHISLASTH